MAAERGPQMARLRPKGKQYSSITWYRVRKGLSDYGYELNLLLAAILWSRESTNTAIC